MTMEIPTAHAIPILHDVRATIIGILGILDSCEEQHNEARQPWEEVELADLPDADWRLEPHVRPRLRLIWHRTCQSAMDMAATMVMAASDAFGMYRNAGPTATSATITTMPVTILEPVLLTLHECLTAEREKLPVTGYVPMKAPKKFATPMAISSWFGSTCRTSGQGKQALCAHTT
jgi:hypothetical protein